MAAIDKGLLFSGTYLYQPWSTSTNWTGTALPGSATTEYSDNEIDFGLGLDAFYSSLANPDVGMGTPMFVNFVMLTAASTGSSPTLTVNLVGATTTAPTTVIQTLLYSTAAATLTAGFKFSVSIMVRPQVVRFIRLQIVAGNAGFTTGTYVAWLDFVPLPNY